MGLQLYVETHGQGTNHHEADMLWGSANRPLSTFLSTAKLQGPGFEKKERFALLVKFYTSLQKHNLTIQAICTEHLFGARTCVGHCWEDTKMNQAWLRSQGAHRPAEEPTTHSFIK